MSIYRMTWLASALLSGCAVRVVQPSLAPDYPEVAARRDPMQLPREIPVGWGTNTSREQDLTRVDDRSRGRPAEWHEADIDAAVASLVARCDGIQLARDIPVACQVDVVGDIARLQLTMANQAAAQRYLVRMWSELARPFCNLANQDAARAGIVIGLYAERKMQIVDCRDGRLSDWYSVDGETHQAPSGGSGRDARIASPAKREP